MQRKLPSLLIIVSVNSINADPSPIDWLKDQQQATGLVLSYSDNGESKGDIYAQALAILAYTASNDITRARRTLDTLRYLEAGTGRWHQCYDTETLALYAAGCNTFDPGDCAWVMMAINYYEAKTHDASYADIAHRVLTEINKLRVTDLDDERYGAIRYCEGTACIYPEAISTEKNLDVYSAFLWRGHLDRNAAYLQQAELVRDYLFREMWADSPDSNDPYDDLYIFWRGFNDFSWCTDPQSWGVLALGPQGPAGENLCRALEWLWYNPYGSTRNQQWHDTYHVTVDGFESCTGDLDHIWLEGTEGVAAAFTYCDQVRADYFHEESGKILEVDGALIHTFTDKLEVFKWYENYRYKSVPSTAWYYFYKELVNPFRPDVDVDSDDDGYEWHLDCDDQNWGAHPGAQELCDAVDNDCDGEIDEDFPTKGDPCTVGLGECERTGNRVCTADGTGTSCSATPGTPYLELCDGLDNDCDEETDEDFPGKGDPCTVGLGECKRSGQTVCTTDGGGTSCSATPGTPYLELCDGLDNDCDSEVDEACTCAAGLDREKDDDVDLFDVAVFQSCVGCAAVRCGDLDFNLDGGVDVEDWKYYAQCLTGPRGCGQ
jgi:hypothetical protein